jgi:hypothetical protein
VLLFDIVAVALIWRGPGETHTPPLHPNPSTDRPVTETGAGVGDGVGVGLELVGMGADDPQANAAIKKAHTVNRLNIRKHSRIKVTALVRPSDCRQAAAAGAGTLRMNCTGWEHRLRGQPSLQLVLGVIVIR